MPFVPLLILLFSLPLAAAGQHIGASLACIWLIGLASQKKDARVFFLSLLREFKIPFFSSIAFILVLIVSSLINGHATNGYILHFVLGHLIWVFLPFIVLDGVRRLREYEIHRIKIILLILCFLLGIIAFSQWIFNWRVVGSSIVSSPPRARGFYSHPLTFAYVSILFLPFALRNWIDNFKSLVSWLSVLGIFSALLFSESRTVLAVAALVVVLNIIQSGSLKARILLLFVGITAGSVVIGTDNPLSLKIKATLSHEGFDRNSGYQDDRIAFWHAHYEIIKEKPILGHGIGLSKDYLLPYYERIGLAHFKRIYPAHNMYIQILANGGIVALLFFLTWYGWALRACWRLKATSGYSNIFMQIFVALALASLTQNSFQDSEVRYSLTIVMTALMYFVYDKEHLGIEKSCRVMSEKHSLL
ncbi:MAG: O-antigen ligase family protein [Bdellovibrionota bacterium]